MGEREEFLDWVHQRLVPAEMAMHAGDAGPRFEVWSTREPVTVLGAWKSGVGTDEVTSVFEDVAASFSDFISYRFEIVAADAIGDLAYTVGFEHAQASIRGEPRTYTLRVTQIYRREDGEWKVAHRHADHADTVTEG